MIDHRAYWMAECFWKVGCVEFYGRVCCVCCVWCVWCYLIGGDHAQGVLVEALAGGVH